MGKLQEVEKQSIIRKIDELLLKGTRSFAVKTEFQEEIKKEYESRGWQVNKSSSMILEFNEKNKRTLLLG